MKRLILSLWFMLALTLTACTNSAQTSNRGIAVTDAWTRPSTMVNRAGAVYLVMQNNSSVDDNLMSAESNVAKTIELHQTKDSGGMMDMTQVLNIPVPGNGKVELKPGGFHIMLIDLGRDLKAGDTITLTLYFEKAGQVPVTAEVRDQ